LKTLVEKLGYQTGIGTRVWQCPEDIKALLTPILENQSETPTFMIGFARSRAEVSRLVDEFASSYERGGHLWICYPKKSGAIETDLTRDVGWEAVDALDLFGVAQISIDATWSALRFRKRDEIASFTRKTRTGGPGPRL